MSPATPMIVRSDLRARAAYAEAAGIHRILPQGVAIPASVEDLSELVSWARSEGRALIPRGAGSSIAGGAVGREVIVDLRERMPRLLEIEPDRSVAHTSAGVTLGDLNQAAAHHGLRLPPDPSSAAWATVGGLVSCNAAGARSVKYGSIRSWVMEVEMVSSTGEVGWLTRRSGPASSTGKAAAQRAPGLAVVDQFDTEVAPLLLDRADLIRSRFPKVRKNSSGYALDRWLESRDPLDLLIGAEGTLGLITTITWRLDPVPAARSTSRIALRSLDDLEAAVRALLPLAPSAIELLDRTFIDLVRSAERTPDHPQVPSDTEAVLLAEFEGPDGLAVRGRMGDAARALRDLASDFLAALTPGEERRLWTLRHAASPILAGLPPDRRSMQVIEDGCVPVNQLGAYIRAIRGAAAEYGLTVVIFGHAGDGNVHVNVLPDLSRPDWLDRVTGLYQAVQESVLALGGTLSGEHGDGRLRAAWLGRLYGNDVVDLFRRVKTAFDPHGILNPGVKVGPESATFDHLKVGPDAVPLPADIVETLRQIERSGGYGRSRLEIADATPG